MPSASAPPATGGRLGPRRTTSSRPSSTRTGRPCRSASSRAAAPHRAGLLAAERAAVGERRRGLAAGLAPGGVGLEVAGLDPAGPQRGGPVAGRELERGPGVDRGPRPWTLPAAARASASVSPTAQPPSPSGTATSAPAGAVSSAKPPWPSATAGATCCGRAALERGSLGGPRTRTRRRFARPSVRNIDGFAVRAPSPVARSHASRIVRQPVQRQRWARRACSTAGWPSGPGAAPLAAAPSSRQTMPGVQNPHWLAPVAQNASAQRSRVASARPSTVVIDRPATRRAGVTQATRGWPSTSTVQHPHCPWGLHPSLAERSPRSSRRTSSSESRRGRRPRPAVRRPRAAATGDLRGASRAR